MHINGAARRIWEGTEPGNMNRVAREVCGMGNVLDARRRGWVLAGGLAGLLLAVPGAALAHEKWFVDPAAYPIRWELLASPPVGVALGTAALALAVLVLLRRIVRDP